VKKNVSKVQPLALLLDLHFKELKKEAFKYRTKIVPFYKILFGWFFNIIENIFAGFSVRQNMNQAVAGALKASDPMQELNGLIEKFKSDSEVSSSQISYLRQKISEARSLIRKNSKEDQSSEKEAANKRDKQRQLEVTRLKNQFLDGKSMDEKLHEYSKRCFVKLGPAKKESEDAVKGAINAHFRQNRGKKMDNAESIKSYAQSIVNTNQDLFKDINDTEAFQKYIELLLLGVFLKKANRK
jgi:hypothetical protein